MVFELKIQRVWGTSTDTARAGRMANELQSFKRIAYECEGFGVSTSAVLCRRSQGIRLGAFERKMKA